MEKDVDKYVIPDEAPLLPSKPQNGSESLWLVVGERPGPSERLRARSVLLFLFGGVKGLVFAVGGLAYCGF